MRGIMRRRLSTAVAHSIKRKQLLAYARPTDNAGVVTAAINHHFALDNTIFKTLPKGSAVEKVQVTKLDTVLDWATATREEVEAAYAALPSPAIDDTELHKFMLEECDFNMEHADGSFLEHLHFCRDFAALHYPEGRPRVLLMHSICGVGTNCFPMRADQLPRLQSLLTPEEFTQVQAFPSVLRLLVHGPLLHELLQLSAEDPDKLGRLRTLKLHRMLDNAPIQLGADELFENLNYQLIHALDFLPAAAWRRTSNDFLFQIFMQLHTMLSRTDQLRCNVGWDESWMQPDAAGARPKTWRHWIIDMLPDHLVMRLVSKQVTKYSAEIGHSLEYELVFE